MITGGAAVMTEAAIILPQKKTSSANIVLIPTVAVREYWLVVSTRAYRNSFQERVKEKRATTTSAGAERGRMI